MKRVLITGTAGFIGFHLANKLVEQGFDVTGLDVIYDYYDIDLKYGRLRQAGISRSEILYNELVASDQFDNYHFIQLKLEDRDGLHKLFAGQKFEVVVNLAA